MSRDFLGVLEKAGAIFTDHHFVYKSGKHGPHYINIDPIFPDIDLLEDICTSLGFPYTTFKGKWTTEVEVVVSAATGGIPLCILTAQNLYCKDGSHPLTMWADKTGDSGFAFERTTFAQRLKGKRTLFVEDLLNVGDTTRQVVAAAREAGADVRGVSVICNRGSQTAESLGVPRLDALCSVDMRAYDIAICPQCKSLKPIVIDPSLGHGAKFQREHPDYPGGFINLLS